LDKGMIVFYDVMKGMFSNLVAADTVLEGSMRWKKKNTKFLFL